VSRWVNDVEPSGGTVSSRHVQHRWLCDVQQLQRWLCVCHWLDVGITVSCDLSVRPLQRVWCDGVQQLQRRLRVPTAWLHERHSRSVSGWHLQWGWRLRLQQLQRWLRMPCCVNHRNAGIVDMSVRSLQCVWRERVQQLQRRLHLSSTWLHERHGLAVCCWIVQWQRLSIVWRV
jgi:hypothetical protein